ncbi:DUF4221 family protein [uncultured Roseivirga sp.]|uniref:DUF4221 family protein n=1 Tax=uncultured Roseivirga sp. TaxID=543088 RepID=UPI0030DC725E|tara:strand:- start:3511 stop:4710 length:1200 start_codon:yes stop_codon:yes gene_type:complete
MKTTITPLLLTFLLIVTACGTSSNKESEAGNVSYELTQLEDKVFMLDDETSVDGIQAQYVVVDGVGYYSFFNRPNRHIYFYNYKTGEIAYKVKLAADGPNEIIYPYGFFEYWVHDFDNIFVNTMQFYYKINKEGEVLKRVKSHENFSFNDSRLSLDASTTFKDGKLYTSNTSFVTAEGDTSWLRANYDFEKGEIEKYYLDERTILPDFEEKAEKIREMAKSGGISTLSFKFAGDNQNLYGTSQISDSLYYFENSEFKETYFAGDPEIKSTDLDGFFMLSIVTRTENSVSIGPNPTQPPHFVGNLHTSPNKQMIYRVLVHGTKPRINPETNKEEPKVFGASLIVFDTKTKKSGVIKLPEELIDQVALTSAFVTEEGIHFPLKEANSESEKTYKVFKVNQL